ncbi:MAG: SDR family oxidoreductase [Gemmobacter sp.]|jgi:3-oxoacyl-[acyl-carrier protein] reductase|nr:SDR family oxidoreductase [Gemmobacter sp.]
MMIDFTGRRVLVSGAARGIGHGIVDNFIAAGAEVVAGDVLEMDFAAPVRCRHLDVTDAASVDALIGAEGDFDIYVHVAGGVLGQKRRLVEEVPPADWDAIYDVNVRGAFLVDRAVVLGMKRLGGGKIVHISSGAGLGVSMTGIQAYASAKAALIGLTRQLAHELGPFGINVNAVAPGFLRTSPDYERQWRDYGTERQEAILQSIPLRRLGEPQDIANAVLFLASPMAAWITGQTLSVDGGPC